MAEFEQILVEQVGDVVRITLNRPERLNAWTPTMLGEMMQVITAGNDDASVGAFVVTGAGRGFCAGADIGSQFAPGVEGKEREERPAADQPGRRLGAAVPRRPSRSWPPSTAPASASASRWCCPSTS